MKTFLPFIVVLAISPALFAQYTVNGNAAQLACNEYRLTNAINTQTGSVWNNNKINLSQSFDFKFDVFLGAGNSPGADGIAFVLQPISTSVGTSGSGLGYQGITPAVGVTIDTYQNGADNDPSYDHIAIQLNGDLNHTTANNIAGPVQALAVDNIEDGNWHSLRISWDVAIQTLTVYMDGVVRVSIIKDFVTDVFAGDPLVYWGFTGSTGGENNFQAFKTALNPSFSFSPTQKRCINEPIIFTSTTISFTTIAKFYWDFGDGSPLDSVNLNPVHIYTVGGDYIVKQRVIGADGCEATNTQTVRIGTIPIVSITTGSYHCVGAIEGFNGIVTVAVGTIDPNGWLWNLGNGQTSTLQNPTTIYNTSGNKNVTYSVKTIEGCSSGTFNTIIYVRSSATADFTFSDSVCLGQPTNFFGTVSSFGADPVTDWFWNIDGNLIFQNVLNPSYTFSLAGLHNVVFFAFAGGMGDCYGIKIKTVYVADKPAAKFGINMPPYCAGLPVQFSDSSNISAGTITQWSWIYNNAAWSAQQNAGKIFTEGNQTVGLVATSALGCKSYTAYKTFYVNPVPAVVINFKDACKNTAVNFSATDISATVTQWKWVFGDGGIATSQNTQHTYIANGNYKVKLYATAATGCYSDSLQKDIIIYGTNAFAGNDTIATAGQPVQLHANGGLSYIWSPANVLNDATSADPVTVLNATQIFTLKAFTPEGCESYDDVIVKIYKGPDIYLPNAFTPNGDTKNDIYKGTPVGIKQFYFLKIFNRWGQQVFYTTDYNKGWNGLWQGQKQNNGVYVVMASGIDFKGNVIDKKGTVMLIR